MPRYTESDLLKLRDYARTKTLTFSPCASQLHLVTGSDITPQQFSYEHDLTCCASLSSFVPDDNPKLFCSTEITSSVSAGKGVVRVRSNKPLPEPLLSMMQFEAQELRAQIIWQETGTRSLLRPDAVELRHMSKEQGCTGLQGQDDPIIWPHQAVDVRCNPSDSIHRWSETDEENVTVVEQLPHTIPDKATQIQAMTFERDGPQTTDCEARQIMENSDSKLEMGVGLSRRQDDSICTSESDVLELNLLRRTAKRTDLETNNVRRPYRASSIGLHEAEEYAESRDQAVLDLAFFTDILAMISVISCGEDVANSEGSRESTGRGAMLRSCSNKATSLSPESVNSSSRQVLKTSPAIETCTWLRGWGSGPSNTVDWAATRPGELPRRSHDVDHLPSAWDCATWTTRQINQDWDTIQAELGFTNDTRVQQWLRDVNSYEYMHVYD